MCDVLHDQCVRDVPHCLFPFFHAGFVTQLGEDTDGGTGKSVDEIAWHQACSPSRQQGSSSSSSSSRKGPAKSPAKKGKSRKKSRGYEHRSDYCECERCYHMVPSTTVWCGVTWCCPPLYVVLSRVL